MIHSYSVLMIFLNAELHWYRMPGQGQGAALLSLSSTSIECQKPGQGQGFKHVSDKNLIVSCLNVCFIL